MLCILICENHTTPHPCSRKASSRAPCWQLLGGKWPAGALAFCCPFVGSGLLSFSSSLPPVSSLTLTYSLSFCFFFSPLFSTLGLRSREVEVQLPCDPGLTCLLLCGSQASPSSHSRSGIRSLPCTRPSFPGSCEHLASSCLLAFPPGGQ